MDFTDLLLDENKDITKIRHVFREMKPAAYGTIQAAKRISP